MRLFFNLTSDIYYILKFGFPYSREPDAISPHLAKQVVQCGLEGAAARIETISGPVTTMYAGSKLGQCKSWARLHVCRTVQHSPGTVWVFSYATAQ